jgi:hypothetical protein
MSLFSPVDISIPYLPNPTGCQSQLPARSAKGNMDDNICFVYFPPGWEYKKCLRWVAERQTKWLWWAVPMESGPLCFPYYVSWCGFMSHIFRDWDETERCCCIICLLKFRVPNGLDFQI